MKYVISSFLIVCAFLSGCGTSSHSTNKPKDGITKSIIAPQTTNSAITKSTDDYYIFTPVPKQAKAKLLIFLPGSLVKPKIYQQVLQTGAKNGVYSVGLSYQNKFTLTGKCRNKGPDCEGNVSREELEGKDFSDLIKVSHASSFEGRIVALVRYMQQQKPDEDWDQFVSNGKIQWNKIIIAGHSQGSSHAAYIGWHRSVARVGMFSGPHNVVTKQGKPFVTWLNDERKTPASRFYGFGNTKDDVTDFSLQSGAWSAMGMKGGVVSVDGKGASFDHSHRLSTSVESSGLFNGAHGSTCVDSQTPTDDQGNPVFGPVWKYMLFLSQ